MVLPLGLTYLLTWEMERNQSFGGGKCVRWFLLSVVTPRSPQRPKAVELSEEIKIGACKWDTQKHIKWGPTSDTVKRGERQAGMTLEGEWQWISEMISGLPPSSAQAGGNSQPINSGHLLLGVIVNRELTCSRWSLILYVWLQTFSMGVSEKCWIRSSVPQLIDEHFCPRSAAHTGSHQSYFCSVAIMVFPSSVWVFIWNF